MRPALLALALTAGPAAAQDTLPGTGSELFRGLLHRAGYAPAGGADAARVVVVFGPPGRAGVAAQCQRVLRAGGSVLVAADDLPALRDHFPTRPPIAIAAVSPRRFDLDRLDPDRQTVGLIGPDDRPGDGLGLAVPEAVAVGLPVNGLVWAGPGDPWTVRLGRQPARVVVAVGGVGPQGRPGRVVLASDSALRNRLLAGRFAGDTDTGNLEFAANLVRWLKPPGDGPVPCLFVDRGAVAERFNEVDYDAARQAELPVPPPPLSAFLTPEAQAKLADAGNQALDRVQANDRLNRPFAGHRYGRAMRWVVGVAALFVAVGLARRARAALRPADPPAAAAPAAVGVLAQRQQERLRGGDHTAAVREYLIDLFRTHGLPLDQYRHPTRMPPVVADAATRERLRTLWLAAYGPHAVTYTRWKELEPMIEAVRADGAAGRWRFAGGQS